jgi:hypothetical protein
MYTTSSSHQSVSVRADIHQPSAAALEKQTTTPLVGCIELISKKRKNAITM